jgi:hypothetical protein
VLDKYTPPPLTTSASALSTPSSGNKANRSRRGTYVIDQAALQTAGAGGGLSPLVAGSPLGNISPLLPPGSPQLHQGAAAPGSALAVPHDPVVRLVLSNGGRATVCVCVCAHIFSYSFSITQDLLWLLHMFWLSLFTPCQRPSCLTHLFDIPFFTFPVVCVYPSDLPRRN